MEFFAKYDFGIKYIKSKENKVVDALSQRRYVNAMKRSQFDLFDQVKILQQEDSYYKFIKELIKKGNTSSQDFYKKDGILYFRDRLVIRKKGDLRILILQKAHHPPYATHPRGMKMREDLKCKFYWDGMKKDIAKFVAKCLECQKVKVEHQHLGGYLYPHDILK